MTPQKIFDQVVDHLITQGRPALSPTGTCKYRTSDGLKCAVGVLIPDHIYRPSFDIESVLPDVLAAIGLSNHWGLLSSLRDAHDRSAHHKHSFNWLFLRQDLARIANLNNLDPTILETIP